MKAKILSSYLALALLLSSCGNMAPNSGGTNASGAPQIWLDQPLNPSEGRVGEVVTVTAHARDGDGTGIHNVRLYINGQVYQDEQTDPTIPLVVVFFSSWAPQNEGVYLVEVDAVGDGGTSRRASAWVTVNPSPTGTPLPTNTPTKVITKTPTSTPRPTITATRPATITPSVPVATGNLDTNCREGSSTAYNINGTLFLNQSRIIEGRNPDYTWWWIQHPNSAGGHCWVSDSVVTITGDTRNLPVIASPPLPPAKPNIPPPPNITHASYGPSGPPFDFDISWDASPGATYYNLDLHYCGYGGGYIDDTVERSKTGITLEVSDACSNTSLNYGSIQACNEQGCSSPVDIPWPDFP